MQQAKEAGGIEADAGAAGTAPVAGSAPSPLALEVAANPLAPPDAVANAAPPAEPPGQAAFEAGTPPLLPQTAAPDPAAPPSAAPPRPAAPVAWPARQIAPFAVALALGPDASISFTLDPGELGRVEVAIERQGGEALVSLRAERPETLALLQRDRAELERALANAGLGGGEGRSATLSFGLGGEGAERRERHGGQAVGGAPRPAAEMSTPILIPAVTRRGLLDLAV